MSCCDSEFLREYMLSKKRFQMMPLISTFIFVTTCNVWVIKSQQLVESSLLVIYHNTILINLLHLQLGAHEHTIVEFRIFLGVYFFHLDCLIWKLVAQVVHIWYLVCASGMCIKTSSDHIRDMAALLVHAASSIGPFGGDELQSGMCIPFSPILVARNRVVCSCK
jgi:uncharacterized membrane protein YciS (DUF1049 family)